MEIAPHSFKGLVLTSLPLEGTKIDDVGRNLNQRQAQLSPPHFADEETEAPGLTVC